MTPAEHIAEAERLLRKVDRAIEIESSTRYGGAPPTKLMAFAAQAHAALAVAASLQSPPVVVNVTGSDVTAAEIRSAIHAAQQRVLDLAEQAKP